MQGANFFAYCSNSPVCLVDCDGRCPWLIAGLVGLLIGAISGGLRSYISSGGDLKEAHDGQMGFEDACYSNASGSFALTTWNDYALVARGIDWWTNSFPTSSATFYPIFDPHGNQVSYISKVSGSSYWQAPQRSFDPWGNLRLGSAGNQPNGGIARTSGTRTTTRTP